MIVWVDTDELYPHYLLYTGERRWTTEFDISPEVLKRYNHALSQFIEARQELEDELFPGDRA